MTVRTSPDAFRAAMAAVCTPVSVVTTMEDGLPYGTTVSAFTSLSLEPPMLLVSLDRNSDLLAMIRRTGRFGLNVLASSQPELAMNFARKGRHGQVLRSAVGGGGRGAVPARCGGLPRMRGRTARRGRRPRRGPGQTWCTSRWLTGDR